MTNTRVLFLLAAGGLGAAACTERSQPIAPSLNADFATRGISDPAAAFIPAYDAGTSVHVVDSLATQSEDTATVQAIGDWNQAWQPSAHEAVLSMDAGDYLLVVKFDSDGAYWRHPHNHHSRRWSEECGRTHLPNRHSTVLAAEN